MMLVYAKGAEAPQFTAEERQAAVQAWVAFVEEAEAAGVLVALLPQSAERAYLQLKRAWRTRA